MVREIVAGLFVLTGVFFFIVSTIGLLRFPDIYTRLHATAKGDTLGIGLCLVGSMIYLGFSITSLKVLVIILFVWITNPSAAHLIAKSAYKAGVAPKEGDFRVFDYRSDTRK